MLKLMIESVLSDAAESGAENRLKIQHRIKTTGVFIVITLYKLGWFFLSALSHKKFRIDAPHSLGRYKEETGGLLSQVEDF